MDSNQYSSPLRVAVLGCGRIALAHVRALLATPDKFVLSALIDSDRKAALTLIELLELNDPKHKEIRSNIKLFSSLDALLAADRPDIVAITLPSGLHYHAAQKAMNAGCHLLLEKPMTLKISEAKDLYQQSEKNGLHIAMGHIYRYLPLMKSLHDEIKDGVWGKISHGSIVVRWGHDQAYYDQAAWRGTWKLDGGALLNQSIHALDLMSYLMGTVPISCSAHLAKRYRNMEAEDVGAVIFEMKNGSLCLLEGTTASPPKRHEASFFINAELGTIQVGIRKGIPFLEIRNINGKNLTFKYIRKEIKKWGLSGLLDARNPHKKIYQNLYHSIQFNSKPTADAFSGYISVESMLCAYRSAKEGKKIRIPSDKDFGSNNMTGFFQTHDSLDS